MKLNMSQELLKDVSKWERILTCRKSLKDENNRLIGSNYKARRYNNEFRRY